ncbi:MAG: DUF2088 domain-containing protein [Promethearchaeota archaeon]|nr:MAG: DUF2088 domain-containing protein [Candidatus Lokiarchaeota archaeon]
MNKMTQKINIPWGAWYGDEDLQLNFPDSWQIEKFNILDSTPIKNRDIIKNKLQNPIGTEPLSKIASHKTTAAIVVDDISRPTKAEPIVKIILEILNDSGISDENITLIFAIGAHRPMNRIDYIKKLGPEITERLNIENHHPYENLVNLGTSSLGTPIFLNKTYYEADVKIALSSVLPHPLAGFGGGAKIILPGISGIETLEANHQAGVRGIGIGWGIISDLRRDIEEVCEKAGLDFSINVVPTLRRETAGLFAGHYIDAHRSAVEFATKIYATKVPPNFKADICLLNLYPEDTELSQATKALSIVLSTTKLIKRGGAVIFLTASTEGRGYHSLLAETGSKLYENWSNTILWKAAIRKNHFGIFSPNINEADVFHFYPKNTIFHRNFDAMVKELGGLYGNNPRVALFPCSMHLTN